MESHTYDACPASYQEVDGLGCLRDLGDVQQTWSEAVAFCDNAVTVNSMAQKDALAGKE